MQRKVNVRRLAGKQLLGTTRHHAVVTDRTLEEGGTDIGCTSGELLLLAIGSCSMGGLRRLFEERGVPCQNLSVDVFFEPQQDLRQRDHIVISINVDHDPIGVDTETIKAAATSGGVTSRMTLGSEVDVRIANARAC